MPLPSFDEMNIFEIIAWCLEDSQYGKPPESGWEDNWGDAVYWVVNNSSDDTYGRIVGAAGAGAMRFKNMKMNLRERAYETLADMVATVGRSILIGGEV